MATVQLLLKEKDEKKLLGRRTRGRSTSIIANQIMKALFAGYNPPENVVEEKMNRVQFNIPDPVLARLKTISESSGLSVCYLIRNILGLDY